MPESGSSGSGVRLLYQVLVVGILMPVLAAVVLWRYSPPSPLAQDREAPPVVVQPVPVTGDLRRVATIEVEWSTPPVLRWAGPGGVVTSLPGGDRRQLRSGDTLAVVSGVPVIVLATSEPMYRDIGPGVRGSDVADLSRALVALGYLPGDDVSDRVTQRVRRAIVALNADRGLRSSVLRRDSVVWLPSDPFGVGEVTLIVGSEAPAPGTVVASGRAEVVKGRVVDGDAASGSPTPGAAGESRVAEWNGLDLEVEGSTLTDTARRELTRVLTPDETELGSAVLRLRDPVPLWRVPSAAVVVGGAGQECVITPDLAAHPVEVVGGGAGYVELMQSPPPEILGNPLDLVEPAVCAPDSP